MGLLTRNNSINSNIRIRITSDPLEASEAIDFVTRRSSGATVLFSGTVRSPNAGQEVESCHYESWPAQAEKVLERIAVESQAMSAYVAHRIGRVAAGQASVVVAVSAPHRAEAFEACRKIIDELKQQAPIWKKEISGRGSKWIENEAAVK